MKISDISCFLFDMDGTLYVSNEIREQFAAAAYHTLATADQISLDRARELIEERRAKLKAESGFPTPYTLTLRSFNIPISKWHKENIKFFDPRYYLHEDKKLKKALIK